jgi:hypothetical protein
MDPLELAHWTDAVYSAIVCSEPDEKDLRAFCEVWFRELVNHREGARSELDPAGVDRS